MMTDPEKIKLYLKGFKAGVKYTTELFNEVVANHLLDILKIIKKEEKKK